ncbi:MAG: HigA family addiction module antidote protein [Treponema sp.]|nr:HigA family addiction module antidote protein [Treponema sp.]
MQKRVCKSTIAVTILLHRDMILWVKFSPEGRGIKPSPRIKVQQTAIGQIIKGNRRITADMALRLSKFFGNSAQFWLNLQNYYDLELEKEKNESLI